MIICVDYIVTVLVSYTRSKYV